MTLEMFRTFSGLVYFAFLFVNLFLLNPLLCLCHKGVKDDGFRAEIADMLRRRRTFVNSDLCSSHEWLGMTLILVGIPGALWMSIKGDLCSIRETPDERDSF